VDWYRGTGRRKNQSEIASWCDDHFGCERVDSGSVRFYRQTLRWENGAWLMWNATGAHGEHLSLMIPGAVWSRLDRETTIKWLYAFKGFGLEATRLDLRIDLFGKGMTFVDDVRASARANELCGTKWVRLEPMRLNCWKGEFDGNSVEIGQPGKNGSGRVWNPYDKGMETGEMPPGEWIRIEGRYFKQVAALAVVKLLEADAEHRAELGRDDRVLEGSLGLWDDSVGGFDDQARALVLGSFDFREVVEGRKVQLKRRKRCAWWQRVIDVLLRKKPLLKLTRKREKPRTVVDGLRWLGTALRKAETMAAKAARPVAQVWEDAKREVDPRWLEDLGSEVRIRPKEFDPVAFEYALAFQ
jgi:hypothetical protein